MNFSLAYDRQLTEPAANLVITGDEIAQAHLSVANRTARNRSGLYQKKHDPQAIANPAVGERTRDRSPDHAALNRTIDEHYQLLLSKHQLNQDASTLVFTISDLTANPMRPHYDNSVVPEQYAYTIANGRYPDGSDARLFYLEDEPLSQIPYTLLIAYEQAGQPCITIQHQVRLNGDGTLPPTIPTTIKNGLKWWAACPPLLIDGKHVPEQYAALDYDVRHTFGFPQTPEVKKALKQLYIPFSQLARMEHHHPPKTGGDSPTRCPRLQCRARSSSLRFAQKQPTDHRPPLFDHCRASRANTWARRTKRHITR